MFYYVFFSDWSSVDANFREKNSQLDKVRIFDPREIFLLKISIYELQTACLKTKLCHYMC